MKKFNAVRAIRTVYTDQDCPDKPDWITRVEFEVRDTEDGDWRTPDSVELERAGREAEQAVERYRQVKDLLYVRGLL
ncbi:hypothetical protein GS448_24525 [Rhodococcus hoagii]|nr:hypothetical protein [Prescottella equi]MBM4670102.1 hypothetical protein [Prescottella equi]NKV87439.1 hypothetical protein [Prescottella equi]